MIHFVLTQLCAGSQSGSSGTDSGTAHDPAFESTPRESPIENEEQTTEPTSSALSLLIDEVTSPNSLLSDDSFVPSLVELENVADEYSNDEIPIGSEVQIGMDGYAANMQPHVSLPLLKREEIEIELSSFSTPPYSPPSQNEVPVKRLLDKKKRKKRNAKTKSVSGKNFVFLIMFFLIFFIFVEHTVSYCMLYT